MKLNRSGFTLVELMVVVAIIGILSAVAVPNFKKFKEKAKMTEPKTNLAAIWTNLSSYQLDNDTYATATLTNMDITSIVAPKFGLCLDSTCTAATLGIAGSDADGTLAKAKAVAGTLAATTFTLGASGTIMGAQCTVTMSETKAVATVGTGAAANVCK